jgi:hypothetical protein
MGCLSDSGMMVRNVTLADSPVYSASDVRDKESGEHAPVAKIRYADNGALGES